MNARDELAGQRLATLRRRNEERKEAEASGVIGGVREAFDVDFLLRYIDRQALELKEANKEIDELSEFQNSIASRVPERYEDDVAQEAIIDRWLDDITTPRTITTAEELDALPIGSVVLSEGYTHHANEMPISFQRWTDGAWHRGTRTGDTHPDNFLPATVLHEGAQS